MSNVEESSHRQILRSSSLMGGASVINVLCGLLRMKVAAVILGPAGVGLLGFLQNLIATASTVAALGSSNVGTRQIADAVGRNDQLGVDASRRALFWGTVFLGVFGSIIFWVIREELARLLLSDKGQQDLVGWAAIGVFFTVAAGSQSALFRGLRKVADLAKVTVFSSIWATAIGVCALYVLSGEIALIIFLLIAPLSSFVIGIWFALKLPRIQNERTPLPLLANQFSIFVKLGLAFMVASLAAPIGQLFVRYFLQNELGEDSLGFFQASWTISLTYIGFVLSAMGADYYPRLTANIHNNDKAKKIVNEQASVAIMLSGPVMLSVISFSPILIRFLYTAEFSAAADILRWQILGDTLKIVSWPLGFVLLAAGRGRLVIVTEFIAVGTFVVCTFLFVPFIGVEGAGLAYMSMYMVHIPMMYLGARSLIDFKFEVTVIRDIAALILLAICIIVISYFDQFIGTIVGGLFAFLFGLSSCSRLLAALGSNSKIGRVLSKMEKWILARK